jgi:hypothetical protein
VLSPLEQAALLLAAEVEMCLRIGLPSTSKLVNALHNFRTVQGSKGSQLDTYIKDTQNRECPVVEFRQSRLKLVKDDGDENA